MPDEPLPSGWLPPQPPDAPTPPAAAPARPQGNWPPTSRSTATPHGGPPGAPAARHERQPSSPTAIAGIACGAAGLLLLVFSLGVSFPITIAFCLLGYLFGNQAKRRLGDGGPGRPGQARAAIVLAAIGLGLAAVAAITWAVLASNGITPQDLQDFLERETQRLRDSG